jgi:uncharacterized protein (DUF1501 family)
MNCQGHLHHGQDVRQLARRWFLGECGLGLGAIALGQLLREDSVLAAPPSTPVTLDPLAPRRPPYRPSAKRVIYLFMGGGPSQLDLFDHKPDLIKFDGTRPPEELLEGYRAAFIDSEANLLGSKFRFARHGRSGTELSELLPHLAREVDDIAVVKSMVTRAFNHAPGQLLMTTGFEQFGRPSLGAWVTYGLGSESRELPGFVVLSSGKTGPSGGSSVWGSGFLASMHQGVPFRSGGDPVLYLSNPKGIDAVTQRDSLATIQSLNRRRLATVGDPEIATRIQSFETAFRMQTSAPELMDLSTESPATLAMYGADPGAASFANNCLLARRLVERGVRFVELFHESWDQHQNLVAGLKENCQRTDQACAALLHDLRQRGLLDDTLVVWGGEFGRTPMVEGTINDGRDHHPNAFSMWLAGGGIRPGVTIGETDDLGFNVTRDPVHVHDLHATILHLLGFDHTQFTFRSEGRDFRLTDVGGEVVEKLLA